MKKQLWTTAAGVGLITIFALWLYCAGEGIAWLNYNNSTFVYAGVVLICVSTFFAYWLSLSIVRLLKKGLTKYHDTKQDPQDADVSSDPRSVGDLK